MAAVNALQQQLEMQQAQAAMKQAAEHGLDAARYGYKPKTRTVITIDEASNGKVITIGEVVRVCPEGAKLADELITALAEARLT